MIILVLADHASGTASETCLHAVAGISPPGPPRLNRADRRSLSYAHRSAGLVRGRLRESTASVFGVTGAEAAISRAHRTSRNNHEMHDQLSRHIKTRLDALLSEADKLRHALTALGSRDEYPKRSEASRSSASRRAEGAGTPTASSSRQRSGAGAKKPAQASSSRQREPREGRSGGPAGNATRSAPGATKRAVLQTWSAGEAMTAGEIAATTGLGRATISTTLSRLAKSGELTKVARGYQIARPASQTTH